MFPVCSVTYVPGLYHLNGCLPRADADATAAPFRGVVSGNVLTAGITGYTFTLTHSTKALFFSDLDNGARFYATLFPQVRRGHQRANVDGVWAGTHFTVVVYCDTDTEMTGPIEVKLERTGGNAFSGTLTFHSVEDSLLCVLQTGVPSQELILDVSGTIAGTTFIGKATFGSEPFEAAVAGTIRDRNTIEIEVTGPTTDPDASNVDEPLDSILRATLTRLSR